MGDLCLALPIGYFKAMRIFLAIAAVLAWLFGAMLLLAPDRFYAPTGVR